MNAQVPILTGDLSQYGSPVAAIFQQPKTAADWEKYVLTAEQIEFFQENGYLNNIQVLSGAQVDLLNEELVRLQSLSDAENELFYHLEHNESEDPDKVLFHAIGGWRITPGFHDLAWAPAFRMAAYQLLGCPLRLFHDQLFCKPAHHGGVVAWHQDFSYWTFTKPIHHLTCWIGLDDATRENGCLYFVPGSHKWGLLPVTGLTGDMDSVREVLTPVQLERFEDRVANELLRGYASFHHPLTMHGSYANTSAHPRRAVVLNSMADGTLGNTDGYERLDALKKFPQMQQDQPLNSSFFPLLFGTDHELAALLKDVPKVDVKAYYDPKIN